MAERESGPAGVEVFEGDACTPEAIAGALSAMTFAIGRRFVIADGVERWKEADAGLVAAALAARRRDADRGVLRPRGGPREGAGELVKAVKAAGGQIAEEGTVKPRELPRGSSQRAAELGIELDNQGARALIAQVGDRQQRLLRELEKLALEHGEGAHIGVEEVARVVRRLVRAQGVDARRRAGGGGPQGGDPRPDRAAPAGRAAPGLLFGMVRRLRDAVTIAEALAAGEPPAQIKGRCGCRPSPPTG